MVTLTAGQVLQNRYQIVGDLGSGGFSTVCLANDLRLPGRQVAIKVMSLTQVNPADRVWTAQQFHQEAQFLALLRHPGITHVSDFFNQGNDHYLVMEYVHGETLEQVLARSPSGRLAEDQAIQIITRIAEVLDYLHTWVDPRTGQPSPIIFRDLKPGNIMVQPDGTLKLIDFGIARFFKPGQSHDTQRLGTPGYAAPEQYGTGQTGARSDVYSLGVLLHQLLTGYDPTTTPMNLPSVRQLNPGISLRVAAAVSQAIEMEPKRRFGNVTAFRHALKGGAGITLVPSPDTTSSRFGPFPRGLPIVLGMLVVVLVVWTGVVLFKDSGLAVSPTTAAMTTETPTLSATPQVSAIPLTLSDSREHGTGESVISDTPTSTPTPTPTATETWTPTPILSRASLDRGRYIAFVRIGRDTSRNGVLDWDDRRVIVLVERDGTNEVQLTSYDYNARAPSWSPDGRRIVFACDRDGDYEIFIMDRDGSDWQQLTDNSSTDSGPSWSPDGEWIAFHSGRDGASEIYRMRPDGTDLTRLTNNSVEDRYPVWAPNSRQLAYQSGRTNDWRVYTMNWDGSNRTARTSSSENSFWPAWSPDGRAIAYTKGTSSGNIYLLNLNTGGETRLTMENTTAQFWSPDGDQLVYACWTGDGPKLFVMDDDGSRARQLTFGSGWDSEPKWSP